MALVRVLLLCLLLSPSYAATPEELAIREGEVVFYSSLNNEQITAFRDAEGSGPR